MTRKSVISGNKRLIMSSFVDQPLRNKSLGISNPIVHHRLRIHKWLYRKKTFLSGFFYGFIVGFFFLIFVLGIGFLELRDNPDGRLAHLGKDVIKHFVQEYPKTEIDF